jgi:hypothetical protein
MPPAQYTPVDERQKPSSGYKSVADRLKAVGGAVVDTAKEVAKAPVRVAMTPADVVSQVATGKSLPPLDIPVLGEAKSYGRQQEEDIQAGIDPVVAGLKNASQGIADVAMIAAPLTSAAPAVKAPLATPRASDVGTAVRDHLTMGRQVADSLGKSKLEAMETSLIEHTKKNIVDGVRERFPKMSAAVDRLDPKVFKHYEDFVQAVERQIASGMAAGAALQIKSDQPSILERVKNFNFSRKIVIPDPKEPRRTQIDTMLEAIAYNESRGEKDAYATTTNAKNRKGNVANGKYQVTTDELKTYAKRFLGRDIKEKEFRANPELQDEYMRNKVAFLMDEGLTPGEILASHRRGLPNWGDKEKLKEKRDQSVEYIRAGMEQYITRLKEKDPAAFEALLQSYNET